MLVAVKRDAHLGAPTVGVWHPAITLGAVIRPGARLGAIVRLGRTHEVVAPDGVEAVATEVAAAGWVEYGHALLTVGEGLAAGITVPTQPKSGALELPDGVTAVFADSDGTIYLTPEPSAPPFVSVGQTVAPRTILALIEVMKTFTPVRAGATGTLERVLVSSGHGVSAGQPLFFIRVG